MDKDQIKDEIVNCTLCNLSVIATPVPGAGYDESVIMFITEAPGLSDNRKGIPFIGKAGKHFDKYLDYYNINKDKIFVTNAIKCRPPYSITPTKKHINRCKVHLLNEIRLIKPLVLVLLGKTAYKSIFNKDCTIKKLRLKWLKFDNVNILVTYHPAYLVMNEDKPKIALDDFKMIKDKLNTMNQDYL